MDSYCYLPNSVVLMTVFTNIPKLLAVGLNEHLYLSLQDTPAATTSTP